jgi:hypothetical protein
MQTKLLTAFSRFTSFLLPLCHPFLATPLSPLFCHPFVTSSSRGDRSFVTLLSPLSKGGQKFCLACVMVFPLSFLLSPLFCHPFVTPFCYPFFLPTLCHPFVTIFLSPLYHAFFCHPFVRSTLFHPIWSSLRHPFVPPPFSFHPFITPFYNPFQYCHPFGIPFVTSLSLLFCHSFVTPFKG